MFIPIVEDKLDKLQPKAKIGQLVGYDEEIQRYYCWVPRENKIMIAWNVRFDESPILNKDKYS